MTSFNRPSWWDGSSFTAKADFLVRIGAEPSFPRACARLGKRKKKVTVVPPDKNNLWYLKESA